jgi:phage shock protein PspC (stress-responsive transcriptional regulator)
VCGGLGKFFGIDSTIIRIVFVLLAFTGFGILAYIIIAIIAPLEESKQNTPQGIIEENAAEIRKRPISWGMTSAIHLGEKQQNRKRKLLKSKPAATTL